MSAFLFDEFSPVSAGAWKQKIQADLKGADYNDSLIWKTNEDILVKPFYHADEFDELPEVSNACEPIDVRVLGKLTATILP